MQGIQTLGDAAGDLSATQFAAPQLSHPHTSEGSFGVGTSSTRSQMRHIWPSVSLCTGQPPI